MSLHSEELIAEAERRGMSTAFWARIKPDAPAVHDRFGSKSFAQVNANANRIVRLLRAHGVVAGDHIAFVSSNRHEVMEIMAANLRGGYRLVPVNWHSTEAEAAFVFDDSDAVALFVDTRYPAAIEASRKAGKARLRIAIGGPAEDHIEYDAALAGLDGTDIPDPILGNAMFYTSGTTGRPKGVYRPDIQMLAPRSFEHYDPDSSVQLCAGPLYHGAPLTLETRTSMAMGVPVVYLEKFEAHAILRTIEQYRITHSHLVPVMMQRLLALPKEVREAYDLSSLTYINHGAAPCPPEIKRAMIDWLGPIIHEYYAGTEGSGGFGISSHDWLRKPGSVGKRPVATATIILDDAGNRCPPGTPGMIYFERPKLNPFSYYKDPGKTERAHVGDFFTLGDIGYLDEDDFLFLTGRSAECIISGGANIYPQEIDNALIKHPAVEDSATVGVPNNEWGEEVKAVIQLRPGFAASDALTHELIATARAELAGYKVPRSIDYVETLPRNPAGKIERHKVRAGYWEGRTSQI